MRIFVPFNPRDEQFRDKLIAFTKNVSHAMILETHSSSCYLPDRFYKNNFDFIGAIGAISHNNSKIFKDYADCIDDWCFGGVAYDYKNEIEHLSSNNYDGIEFPDSCFFQPSYIITKQNDQWRIGYNSQFNNENDALRFINSVKNIVIAYDIEEQNVSIDARINKSQYINNVNRLKGHIHRGDIYEANYCMEFYNNHTNLDPIQTYIDLLEKSPVPFAAFYKNTDKYLLSASPERYMKKTGNKLMSQPIKGTARRGVTKDADEKAIQYLKSSAKERSENIMITDLVRNDLSRVAKKGSVKVEELCGIYSFKQVHQMISTISAKLDEDKDWYDAIIATFPMGSMTGAPKLKAMELIEKYEVTKRGLYSGAVGYITPEKDFDFNVVIRSILYNQTKRYLSFMVGSAITNLSIPEDEYEECLLKAKAIIEVLNVEKN